MHPHGLEFKNDPLNSFDGRCRILSAALVILAVANASEVVLLCVVALAGLCAAPREASVTVRRLIPVNMMSLALWLPVIAGLSPHRALLYTLRINCAALASMRFVVPMGISLIASSMTALRVNEKLVSLFVLTYRSLFLLNQGFATALAAMRSRLPEHTTAYQWRSLAAVFAAALTRAGIRSEKVRVAMSSRGFDGGFPATVSFVWRLRDSVLLAACAVFFGGLVWLA
jgi:energy-coupling factor transporter transmembrane protein EcfT